jgi:cytoskeleton protein RodZ
LPSFGEKLKQERETRKISLEQISASTKIGTRMLQALEEDRFNQLPGGIFNKGFVRAYARCLGLDEDQTVADYLEASGDLPTPATEFPPHDDPIRETTARENEEHVRRMEASVESPIRHLPWGWFAAALLLVALALSIWTRQRQQRISPPLHSAPAAAAAPPFSTPTVTPASAATSGPAAEPGRAAAPPVSQGTSSLTDVPAAPTTSQVRAPQDFSPPGSTAAAAGGFTVAIHARDESWISITIDGQPTPSETLPPGSERTVQGNRKVVVKTGNAGGVEIRFNGQKVDTGAGYGEVKTLTFGPSGLLPSPPASSPATQ